MQEQRTPNHLISCMCELIASWKNIHEHGLSLHFEFRRTRCLYFLLVTWNAAGLLPHKGHSSSPNQTDQAYLIHIRNNIRVRFDKLSNRYNFSAHVQREFRVPGTARVPRTRPRSSRLPVNRVGYRLVIFLTNLP